VISCTTPAVSGLRRTSASGNRGRRSSRASTVRAGWPITSGSRPRSRSAAPLTVEIPPAASSEMTPVATRSRIVSM
jgi:hypothetical protein